MSTVPAAILEADGPPPKKARGPLSNDIADMLFGFGDSWPPNTQTVNLVEALVTEYIQDLGARALQVADLRPDGKLDKECFLYIVRKDKSKFQRANRLLLSNQQIKAAQKIDVVVPEEELR
jgi:transcription initiation factor TFIID subunit 13